MAKLEIDISVKGAADSESKVKRFADNIQRANDIIGGLNRQSMQLEKELASLNRAFNSGAISESKFNNESQRLSIELTKVRSNMASQNAQLRSYKATLDQATTSNRSFGTAQKQLQAYSNDFTGGIRSANTVALEFSRIIQDAPYGMQGVANNIQQLTANWGHYVRAAKEAAAAQGQTIGTFGLLRGAVSSLFSPVNLLTLGISAVTAGWVVYEKWQQKSKKATKENEDQMQSMIKALNNVSTTLYNASTASGAELAELRLLYKASTDTAKSIDERRKAAQQLVNKYPDLFEKMGTEKIMLGEAKNAYDRLSTSILATARAQAAYGRIGEKSSQQFAIDETNKGLREQLALTDQRIKQQEKLTGGVGRSVGGVSESVESGNVSRLNKLYSERSEIQKSITDNLLERAKLQEDILDLEQLALSNQGKMIVGNKNSVSGAKDLYNELAKIAEMLGREEAIFSLNSWETKLFDIDKKYKDIQDTINKTVSGAENARLNALADQTKELERQKVLIDRFIYDGEKLKKSMDPLNKGVVASLMSSEVKIPDISTALSQGKGLKTIGKLDFTDKKLEERLGKVVERGLRRGIDDIFSSITDLGGNFYEVFSNVFSKLANTVTSTFGQVLSTQLGDLLSSRINNKDFSIGGLGSTASKALVAGGGLLGSILSSQGQAKVNTGMMIGGGALSGAAAGAAFGPIGAAAGAVIGAIAGIFQSSGAKKQQKLQEEALEEQKKQTKLQERAAALSYTSSIISQQIAGLGIVTGLDRNEFGELVARVSGSDLEIVLQRNRDKR